MDADPKLLSDDELKAIAAIWECYTNSSSDAALIAYKHFDKLLSHIAAQAAEIALLRMNYRNAMESARRSAWHVAEWDFSRNDDEDLSKIGYETADEWTAELKALADRPAFDDGAVSRLTQEIERLRAIPDALHRYGQVSADIDHQFVEETDKGEYLRYDEVVAEMAAK